jgi:hypothetical protein
MNLICFNNPNFISFAVMSALYVLYWLDKLMKSKNAVLYLSKHMNL